MPSVRATASSAPRRGKRHQFSFPTKFMYFILKNSEISFVIALPEKKTDAILKIISGRQIGQKWSYNKWRL